MVYTAHYKSPIGDILLAAKDGKLIGLWIEGQKYYLSNIEDEIVENDDINILNKTKCWLDKYFNGEKPSITELDIAPIGNKFKRKIWDILIKIPYGEVTTYKDIANKVCNSLGISKMSAQAVGNAVGHNPISIIIPCHRVIGTNDSLTGYAAGIDKKKYLLEHEGVNIDNLSVSKEK